MSPEFCWGAVIPATAITLCRVCEFAKTIAPGLDLAFARPMKKPRKPSGEPVSWNAHFRNKLAWLGRVEAKGRDEALKKAIEQHKIREADRWRISVQPE